MLGLRIYRELFMQKILHKYASLVYNYKKQKGEVQ